jgi:hypothetical protein
MKPHPITEPDFHVRAHSVYDLEVTLVKFIKQVVAGYRFDNPTLNLAQATEPEHPIVRDLDQPPVSYDPTERAQTLALKQPPRVERGRIPRSVTGEVAIDRLPDFPAVIVQALSGHAEINETTITAKIFVNMYDENPESGGYQDCLNITEALVIALTSYGQGVIDKAYPIVMPIDWKLLDVDAFPHFIAEITTNWTLPSARALPELQLGYPYIGEEAPFPFHG